MNILVWCSICWIRIRVIRLVRDNWNLWIGSIVWVWIKKIFRLCLILHPRMGRKFIKRISLTFSKISNDHILSWLQHQPICSCIYYELRKWINSKILIITIIIFVPLILASTKISPIYFLLINVCLIFLQFFPLIITLLARIVLPINHPLITIRFLTIPFLRVIIIRITLPITILIIIHLNFFLILPLIFHFLKLDPI